MILKGVAASPGIGIGHIVIIEEPNLEYKNEKIEDVEAEKVRLNDAISSYCDYTQEQAASVKANIGEKEANILLGHITMVQDPYMQGEMLKLIDGNMCAEEALVQICEMFATMFEASGDALTAERASDVRDVKTGVLCELLNKRPVDMSTLAHDSIVVTHDLTPSMTASIQEGTVVGFITETGGLTSHSAILARAMEIPAVLALPNACKTLRQGEHVIINGLTGDIIAEPSEAELKEARIEQESYLEEKRELTKYIGCRTVDASGNEVELFANIGRPDDANQAMEKDAEGIGLFRTEFLFMDSTEMPTEDEQFEAYKKVAILCKNKPVIIRTLDIGGDKEVPYLGLEKEDNPFLGFRAIRYCLAREDIYRTQLRALLRASAFGDIRIMIPLVTCLDEVVAVKNLIKRYMQEFDQEGIAYNKEIKVGVMIETPAASIMAEQLAKEVDFFSIGTNDLTGYTLCVDRGNDKVRYLYLTYNPAVLRSIKNVIAAGVERGIPVGMCGEAAADPLLIPLWISFGLTEYSVSPTSTLSTRKIISLWSKEEADELAEKVLNEQSVQGIYDILQASSRK